MKILLVPIAPLSRTKSRLRDCFTREQLKKLTLSIFKDLGAKLLQVDCFDEKIVYCSSDEILELAENYNLIGIKEQLTSPPLSFAKVIEELNNIAINKYNAQETVITFLDLILISSKNFYEISSLLEKNQIVVCPAIHSSGISVFCRKPPDIVSSSCFSDPKSPSLISLFNEAAKKKIKMILYDSFRAGFDVDIKQDLVLAYQYLKIFNLKDTETYIFLKNNLKLSLQKGSKHNNRDFTITKKKTKK